MKRVCAILLVLGRVAVRGLRASPVTSSVAVLTIAIALMLGFALLAPSLIAKSGDNEKTISDEALEFAK